MICIQLSGGLGNQLFQYAFGRSLSHDLDTELYVDISHYNWPRQDEIKHVVYGLQAYNIKGIVGNYGKYHLTSVKIHYIELKSY